MPVDFQKVLLPVTPPTAPYEVMHAMNSFRVMARERTASARRNTTDGGWIQRAHKLPFVVRLPRPGIFARVCLAGHYVICRQRRFP